MDHAEVRAWLADAFFRPGLLRALDDDERAADDDPQIASLREHLAACADCGAELAALRSTAVALDLALGPPAGARQRVLSNVATLGRQRRPQVAPPWWRRATSLRAAAALAVVAVIVFGLGTAVGLLLSSGGAEPRRLPGAVAQLTERLAEPDAQRVILRDLNGSDAGIVVHSPTSRRLAVFTTALAPPSEGRYECWLERDGQNSLIGPMNFEQELAFWAGPLVAPADAGQPGDRFLVKLDQADAEPELSGEF